MTQFRGRMFLKFFPVVAVIASAHIALAAEPEIPVRIPTTTDAAVVSPLPAPLPVPPTEIVQALPVATDDASADPAQVECVAKVIVHEAGNQPHRGQIAVAQVIRTRVRDGRFGRDACSVVKQRGQFFDVAAYQPSRSSARWTNAVAIATDTLNGAGEEVVPGALFFHAAGAAMPGRVRVAQVADHIFYR